MACSDITQGCDIRPELRAKLWVSWKISHGFVSQLYCPVLAIRPAIQWGSIVETRHFLQAHVSLWRIHQIDGLVTSTPITLHFLTLRYRPMHHSLPYSEKSILYCNNHRKSKLNLYIKHNSSYSRPSIDWPIALKRTDSCPGMEIHPYTSVNIFPWFRVSNIGAI